MFAILRQNHLLRQGTEHRFFPKTQGRKTNPNPNFMVRISSGGVGVFHVKGWGRKSLVCPSKPGKSNFLGGIFRDFAGVSLECPKSLRKKVCVQFSFPKNTVFTTLIFLSKLLPLAFNPSAPLGLQASAWQGHQHQASTSLASIHRPNPCGPSERRGTRRKQH